MAVVSCLISLLEYTSPFVDFMTVACAHQANERQKLLAAAVLFLIRKAVGRPLVQELGSHAQAQEEEQQHACAR